MYIKFPIESKTRRSGEGHKPKVQKEPAEGWSKSDSGDIHKTFFTYPRSHDHNRGPKSTKKLDQVEKSTRMEELK